MASHDTDPDDSFPTTPSASGSDEAAVESLLADLSRAPLPVEGVQETAGQMAAAANVAPHRPPRATEGVSDGATPAVVLNTTQPLPVVVPARPAGATTPMPAPQRPVVRDTIRDVAAPHPHGAPLHTTTPSLRVRSSRRVILAAAAVLAVAAGTAIAIAVLGGREHDVPAGTAATRAPASSVGASTSAMTAAMATASASAPAMAATSGVTDTAPVSAASALEPAPVFARPSRVVGARAPAASTTATATTPPVLPATTRSPAPPVPMSSGDFPWRQ